MGMMVSCLQKDKFAFPKVHIENSISKKCMKGDLWGILVQIRL